MTTRPQIIKRAMAAPEQWRSATNRFADLPLNEFEVSRVAQGQRLMLRSAFAQDTCLAFTSMNELVEAGRCDENYKNLWVFDSTEAAFKLARDATMCLDVFHGASLGTYWCHGAFNLHAMQTTAVLP